MKNYFFESTHDKHKFSLKFEICIGVNKLNIEFYFDIPNTFWKIVFEIWALKLKVFRVMKDLQYFLKSQLFVSTYKNDLVIPILLF